MNKQEEQKEDKLWAFAHMMAKQYRAKKNNNICPSCKRNKLIDEFICDDCMDEAELLKNGVQE